jgi:uncharacterized protein involved in exopolysaccharide biosynthesis
MMEPQPLHPLDYLTVVKRRKWWFVVPLLVCIAAGAALLAVWPKKYLSKVGVGVANPTLSPDFVRGVSSMDPVERQRAISQLLLSPSILERVVREEKINRTKPTDEVAASLRANLEKNIEVPNPIGLNGRPDPSRGVELFYLGYMDRDPERARRVADRVASVFVEETSKAQTMRAENTSEMLGEQVKSSQEKLTQLEGRLRAKKQAYMGRLPDQVGANVQMVNGARSQLESISMQIRAEQDHLTMVESQIDQMRQGVGVEGMTTTGMAAAQNAQKHVDDLEAQLAADRALGYTDKHPDIDRLQREIRQARADLAASKVPQPSNRDEVLKADPLYHQKIQERDMARLHIRELQASSAGAQRQIGEYQTRVESAPIAEQELASIDRDYKLELARYNDVNTKYQQARTAEELARNQGGERFSVL